MWWVVVVLLLNWIFIGLIFVGQVWLANTKDNDDGDFEGRLIFVGTTLLSLPGFMSCPASCPASAASQLEPYFREDI